MCWRADDLTGRAVLDLCSGTGILGLTAARLGARATAVDLSRRAVVNARLNARLNRLALEVLRGDLFEPRGRAALRRDRLQPALHPRAARRRRRTERPARGTRAPTGGRSSIASARARRSICGLAAAYCSCTRASPGRSRPSSRLAERGLEPAVVAEHDGTLGPVARGRLDYLRSIGVADGSLAERMVVVEGRMPVAVLEPVA